MDKKLMETKNICFITSASLENYGGGEKWLIAIANSLQQHGYNVTVYGLNSRYRRRVSIEKIRKEISFKYEELEIRNRFLPIMAKRIPDNKFDVIYVMSGYYFHIKQALRMRGKKIYGGHDPSMINPNSFMKLRILKALFPKFDSIHIISEVEKKWKEYNGNLILLENTYFGHTENFREKTDDFTAIFYGRHEKIKGTDTIKYIINNLDSSITLVIAGSGTDTQDIQTERKNIKFLDFINDEELYSIIRRGHVVIFPSYKEVSPLVAYEALGNYTPLIYRNTDFNYFLRTVELCFQADDDKDFLDGLNFMFNLFKEERKKYNLSCSELPKHLVTLEKYIVRFMEMIDEN